MSIASMSLGLPSDIDADPSSINDGAEDLDGVCSKMYGRAEGLDIQFNGAAGEFTDLVAWDISSASAKELQSWRAAGEALTHGAAILRLWAEDIETYRLIRADLHERWETAKTIAQSRVDHPVVSASTSGRSGGLAEGIFDAVTSTKDGREEEERTALMGLACELAIEHDTAWEALMDQADQVKKDLRSGPSEETLERLVAAGHLGWAQAGTLPEEDAPLAEFAENADPGAVNNWWESLSEADQDAAMADYPEILRNLDGIPVVVRNELNRDYLEDQIDNLSMPGAPPNPYMLEQLQEIRDSIDGDDKFLIFFDPYARGGGQAAISTGDPDQADNVSTMVPGMLNNMGTLETPIERSEKLREQMVANDPDSEHASIVWMGYNAPLDGEYVPDNAANGLADFQDGLRATHQGRSPSHNTVIGHSWGGYVAGAADNPDIGGGLDADSLVLIGAPASSVDHVTELSMDPDDVHVIQGDDDWIEELRNHADFEGPGDLFEHQGLALHKDEFFENPENSDEEFGNRLDPEKDTGHSDYFEDEETLTYLGEVLTGGRP